jgi:hypothetical protein
MTHTPNKYFANPAFREYIFLLVELERLVREGRNNAPEGDAIYEEMDTPGDKLDADEAQAVKDFASDLTRLSQRYASILLATANSSASHTTDPQLTEAKGEPIRSHSPGPGNPRELIP